MPEQFVLEVEFRQKHNVSLEKQLIVIDEGSVHELSKLREDLSQIALEPFTIRYVDEENDLISVDTEEEFKELAKFIKECNLKGNVAKILVNSKSTDSANPKMETGEAGDLSGSNVLTEEVQWKKVLKSEIKKEIMQELYHNSPALGGPSHLASAITRIVDGSQRNLGQLTENWKFKCTPKKRVLIVKRSNSMESKPEQRIDKTEYKRKKLNIKAKLKGPFRDDGPKIISGIATPDSSMKEIGKIMSTDSRRIEHEWRITNDGTVSWKDLDVKLHHVWSSPGLQAAHSRVPCPQLRPGETSHVIVVFTCSENPSSPLKSYWHFVYGHRLTQFGHYLCVTIMNCTQPKESWDGAMGFGRTVTFNQEPVENGPSANDDKDGASCNEPMRKQLKASLASAEIAAEMAKVAANAALRAASGLQATSQSEMDQLTKRWNDLHVTDGDSDDDINMDVNEESHPGFVMVDMSSLLSSANGADKNNEHEVVAESSVGDKMNLLPSQKCIKNDTFVCQNEQKPIHCSGDVGKDTDDPIMFSHVENACPFSAQSLSRPDPDIRYQCPMPIFTPQHTPHGYPVVFPPPPVNYFPPAKISHVPYTQFLPPTFIPPPFKPPFLTQQPPITPGPGVHDNQPVFVPPQSHNLQTHAMPLSNADTSQTNQQLEIKTQPEDITVNTDSSLSGTALATNNETQVFSDGANVQILPQGLVDGAINATAKACSTAWNAFNSIYPKNEEFDTVFQTNLALLAEMGFVNLERNTRLLKLYNNDVTKVIGVICSPSGGDNLGLD